MNVQLLKKLGNIEQLAGIRESRLADGKGKGTAVCEFHNAAGLRFTVLPDRGMDIYDLSYRGFNLSFLSKNGIVAPERFSPLDGEFSNQWSAGALVTCGLDNVGGHSGSCPTHGRYGYIPASGFGTEQVWEGEDLILRARGEMRQTALFGRNLSLKREIETSLMGTTVKIHDVITNYEAEEEPYMLLYHCNFGYPLLRPDSIFATNGGRITVLNGKDTDPNRMSEPVDGCGEELFLYTDNPARTVGVLYNRELELGVYLSYNTENLPNMLEWKRMRSHDYVLAMEPCNTCGLDRAHAIAENRIARLPAYSSVENTVELGVLDGIDVIEGFLRENGISRAVIHNGQ